MTGCTLFVSCACASTSLAAGFVLGEEFGALTSGLAVAWDTLGPQMLVALLIPSLVVPSDQYQAVKKVASTLLISESAPLHPSHTEPSLEQPAHATRASCASTPECSSQERADAGNSSNLLPANVGCQHQVQDEVPETRASSDVDRDCLLLATVLTLPFSGRMFTAMLCAAIHRHHLMIWAVFAPRLLFESCAFVAIQSVCLMHVQRTLQPC